MTDIWKKKKNYQETLIKIFKNKNIHANTKDKYHSVFERKQAGVSGEP